MTLSCLHPRGFSNHGMDIPMLILHLIFKYNFIFTFAQLIVQSPVTLEWTSASLLRKLTHLLCQPLISFPTLHPAGQQSTAALINMVSLKQQFKEHPANIILRVNRHLRNFLPSSRFSFYSKCRTAILSNPLCLHRPDTTMHTLQWDKNYFDVL